MACMVYVVVALHEKNLEEENHPRALFGTFLTRLATSKTLLFFFRNGHNSTENDLQCLLFKTLRRLPTWSAKYCLGNACDDEQW